MKTFLEFLRMSADTPPQGNKETVTSQQKDLLKTDLKTGALSQQDFQDIMKMLDDGWRFDDALSVAKQQSNKRKYLNSMQNPMP